jgi:hypothetical protein
MYHQCLTMFLRLFDTAILMPTPPKKPHVKKPSRANYLRTYRSKKKIEAQVADKPHWSLALIPLAQDFILAYRERTAVLSARTVDHGVPIPVAGLTINGAAPAFHPGAGAAELLAVDHGVPATPPGVPTFVVGKYPDDPTGQKPEVLFTLDVELTDDCQAYFRDHFPNELATIREYQTLPEPFDMQMMRCMFQRLKLPIPADDPKAARAFYPRPAEEPTQS